MFVTLKAGSLGKRVLGLNQRDQLKTSNSMNSCGVFIEQFLLPAVLSLDFDCFMH